MKLCECREDLGKVYWHSQRQDHERKIRSDFIPEDPESRNVNLSMDIFFIGGIWRIERDESI
jgi:hypothetical protein